jgi:hypothetical protein
MNVKISYPDISVEKEEARPRALKKAVVLKLRTSAFLYLKMPKDF